MLDYELFLNKVNEKAESNSFENNIDTVLVICMRDLRNYKYYITENAVGADVFSLCYETFAHIIMNRDDISNIETDKYCSECDKFLESLQEEDLEYFDECVNITCELMHLLAYIKTKDIRNIIAAVKLAFESAEAHFQKCDLSESEYASKIEEFAEYIENLDVSGMTSFLSYN